jgi:hypothetical protein
MKAQLVIELSLDVASPDDGPQSMQKIAQHAAPP